MKYIGIIPARYASTRFPGKPLAVLGGKTVIQRVYEQAVSVLPEAYVATDDERIFACVEAFGGRAVMTRTDHKSGTDRIEEAMEKIEEREMNIEEGGRRKEEGDGLVVINIQGTENVLLVPTEAIRKTSAGAFVYTSYDEETKLFGGIVPVEVGISNDEFTEVRSGLDEGTTVYYTEKERNDFFMMMGGPGGSGRRPSGGYYG